MENNFVFQLIKDYLPVQMANNFSNLIFFKTLEDIKNGKIKGTLFSFIALNESKPAGLAFYEITSNKTAFLHSVCTLKEFQRKGIALKLLQLADNFFRKNKINYVDTAFAEVYPSYSTIINLLKKRKWNIPQATFESVKFDNKKVLESAWVKKAILPNGKISILNWEDIQDKDKEDINKIINMPNFKAFLNPFQLPKTTHGTISKFVKINGEVVAWCMFSYLTKSVIQQFSAYVLPKYRGDLIKNIFANSAYEMVKLGFDFTIYQNDYEDMRIVKFNNYLFNQNKSVVSKSVNFVSRKYY